MPAPSVFPSTAASPRRATVLLFFFLSGIAGLIYEVVWSRLLALVMGNTHYAVATVLATFMGGLALGGFCGGRLADRGGNPVKIYAGLEFAIGIFCLLVPALIQAALPVLQWIYAHYQGAYLQASLLRFLVCAVILLVPTALMGATLPVLGKFVAAGSSLIGRDVGVLYAANTFGAVFGALISAFALMPWLGLRATIWFAAAINMGIAVAVLLLFRGHDAARPESAALPAAAEAPLAVGGGRYLLLAVFCGSGIAAMIYQVAWNRIFSLVLGSSVYAFSLIVTTFILGLAAGAAVFSGLARRLSNPVRIFGMLQAGIGVAALAALPAFGFIPLFNKWVYAALGQGFATMQAANFAVIFTLLFAPTFCMGAQFPMIVKALTGDPASVGRDVGLAYSVNTLGTIAGAFAGGFILIPWLGIQNAIVCGVLINVFLGCLVLVAAGQLTLNARIYALPLLLIGAVWGARAVPPWDQAVISSGSYMPYRIRDLDDALRKTNKILFYREGLHTTVTAELAVSGNIFLRVNGKTDASLALDMRTQLLSGYLPMLLHAKPESALVIGQGSGITLGAVEQFPVRAIDLVEISQEVIDGSRFFAPFNHDALADKRLNVVLEDGRNHVALTDKKYDVIISEPSNPWISGVGALFTREFFELLRARLQARGIACIWVHTNMSPDNFKSIVKTFSAVFPFVTMWESIVGDDYLLIGSGDPYVLDYERVMAALRAPLAGKDFARIGIRDFRDLASVILMSGGMVEKFGAGALWHTDDNLHLEFNAPYYLYKDERQLLARQLAPFFYIDPAVLRVEGVEAPERERILAEVRALARSASQVEEIKRAARIDTALDRALDAFGKGDFPAALAAYGEILELDPEHVMGHLNMGNVYRAMGDYARAEAAYARTVEINPFYVFGHLSLAKLHLASGRAERAVEALQRTAPWYRMDAEMRVYLGVAYLLLKERAKAYAELQAALAQAPDFALAHYYLGLCYFEAGDAAATKRHMADFLALAAAQSVEAKLAQNARDIMNKL